MLLCVYFRDSEECVTFLNPIIVAYPDEMLTPFSIRKGINEMGCRRFWEFQISLRVSSRPSKGFCWQASWPQNKATIFSLKRQMIKSDRKKSNILWCNEVKMRHFFLKETGDRVAQNERQSDTSTLLGRPHHPPDVCTALTRILHVAHPIQ